MSSTTNNALLLRFALRYPGWIVITTALGFSGALFNGIGTTLIVPIILQFLGQPISLEGLPPMIQNLFASLSNNTDGGSTFRLLGAILGLIILKNLSSYASTLASSHLTRSLTNEIRLEGLGLLLEVDWNYFTRIKAGDLINRLGGEVGRTASAIRMAIQIMIQGITVVVFLWLLLAMSWRLTILASLMLGLVTLINQFFVRRARWFGEKLATQSRDYSVKILEMISGIRLVKATANEAEEFQALKGLIRERERADFESQANTSLVGPVNEVLGIGVVLGIVFLGQAFFKDQVQGAGSTALLAYLVVLFRMLPYVAQLNGLRSDFANSAASVKILVNFLRRDDKPFMSPGTVPFTQLNQGIRFEQLQFAYPGNETIVIDGLTLDLPKGTTLALVGSSGAGKSTLADLLPRFYDPTQGRILIDGRDLRDFEIHSLRRAMGVVSQDTFLFNTSVRRNIAYASPQATEAQIIEAAKRANAYEFIVNLPKGFETPIGDRGVMLSGGQRQRLAIARALLRNPQILILDEATSALDTVSERLVQQAIDELSRDRTTLVIAHRLSTIRKAHQIAVLSKGRVVELGTHEELLALNGHYTELYNLQFSEQMPDDAASDDEASLEIPVLSL